MPSLNLVMRGIQTKVYLDELKKIVSKLSRGNNKAKVLFHVDEHRKMCDRTSDIDISAASFCKGAMETLAEVPLARVVATCTEKPDLPQLEYSEVCRYPVGIPPFDIVRAMKETKLKNETGNYYYPLQIQIDKKNLDCEEKRLFAILKFKLAMKLTKDMNNLHFPDPDHKKFLKEFHEIAVGIEKEVVGRKSRKERKEKLKSCCNLRNVKFKWEKSSPYATTLLLGVDDADYEKELAQERFSGLIQLLVYGKKLITTLNLADRLNLVNIETPTYYKVAKERKKYQVKVSNFLSKTCGAGFSFNTGGDLQTSETT